MELRRPDAQVMSPAETVYKSLLWLNPLTDVERYGLSDGSRSHLILSQSAKIYIALEKSN